jgi:hypothetical protein
VFAVIAIIKLFAAAAAGGRWLIAVITSPKIPAALFEKK